MLTQARVAFPMIVPRAIILWAMTRLLIAVLPLSIGAGFGSMWPPPPALVLLAGILGFADVHVRGERILWGNLGVRYTVLVGLYAAAAIPGELLLSLARA
jgi:hypothetical protein